ncbi:hypothetical protein Q4603_02210 [Zobellia galactanivorans]|uniref:hypothetical protein n=1 Tax=Zobellia galactanivorans (strain DSM 12802 / CCUG 47099 / CIP 106680 / NCIMB 13871 / Dsij) TaxID=63186 RepID=UPI0026E33D52|nr:hypothetical protein [Zobellia galactanivorans]MDO6807398.1 hypothetical protein [Zobellia galactanivorans]
MKMNKVLLALLLLSFGPSTPSETTVYICKGKGSKKYHYVKNCRGLSRCSTRIYQVPLHQAKEIGRGLCGWED